MVNHWQRAYQQQQAQEAHARQVRAAKIDAWYRNHSANQVQEQLKSMSDEERRKITEQMKAAAKKRAEQEKARREKEKRERTERNQREFYDRLKDYGGPLDPLLKLLKIKSKRPTIREIKSCYLTQIRIHHPDAGGDVETAKKINAAYTVLMEKFTKP